MKRRTIVIILILSIFLVTIAVFGLIQSINFNSHPVYYSYKNENGEKSISINGTEYSSNYEWSLDDLQTGNISGFLDNKREPIYEIKGDNNKDFLCVRIQGETVGYEYYFRKGFIFPQISADSVIKIEWRYPKPGRTIEDKELINEFFNEINNGEQVSINSKREIVAQIADMNLYFNDVPGLCYRIYFDVRKDGSFLCHFPVRDNEYKFSADLLERIAGHKIDVKEEIEAIIRSEKNLEISD